MMNVVLIHTDQQRRDALGIYGNQVVQTPAVDALARRGVVFGRAFTPVPLCGPARASLLTGLRPLHHGILFNDESGSVAGRDFTRRPPTVAELLAEAGCRSVLCGKWHVGTTLTPAECGFEGIFYPGYGYPKNHPHYQAYLARLGTRFSLRDEIYSRGPGGSSKTLLAAIQDGPEAASVPHYLVDQAIDAIRESAGRGERFFVRCDFWGPHAPYIIPERYAAMYDPARIEPWPNFPDSLAGKPEIQRAMRRYWGVEDFDWPDWARLVAMCYGYVTLIDDEVARLLAALDELGVADETAILFASDHGGMVGGHGLADKGPYLYDEVCRVPLLAYVPGLPGGRRSEALVYSMDMMPTILELAGCPSPPGLDAVSLMPILSGQAEKVCDEESIFVEFHGHQSPYAQRLVRTATAKYVFNAGDIDELYDLENDPHELRNRAADPACGELLGEMRQLLRQWLVDLDDPILKFFGGDRLSSYLDPH